MDIRKLCVKEILEGMTLTFNPEAAGELTADIQFCLTGEEPGDYFLHIENGECKFSVGTAEKPNLTIYTASEIWKAISTGELDGQAAFMSGKYKVKGDFSLLMKLDKLFETADKEIKSKNENAS